MSYDLLIDRGGEDQTPLGSLDDLQRAVAAVFPTVVWTRPGWGTLDEGSASIEFNLPAEPPLMSFGIHLRGDFIVFLERIDRLAASNGWVVFDPQNPEGDG